MAGLRAKPPPRSSDRWVWRASAAARRVRYLANRGSPRGWTAARLSIPPRSTTTTRRLLMSGRARTGGEMNGAAATLQAPARKFRRLRELSVILALLPLAAVELGTHQQKNHGLAM